MDGRCRGRIGLSPSGHAELISKLISYVNYRQTCIMSASTAGIIQPLIMFMLRRVSCVGQQNASHTSNWTRYFVFSSHTYKLWRLNWIYLELIGSMLEISVMTGLTDHTVEDSGFVYRHGQQISFLFIRTSRRTVGLSCILSRGESDSLHASRGT
jgi:hypothetical protein